MDLKNKTAIVTGVSRGIGRSITLALLEKGANVAGWGRTKPEYEHENFLFIETDVSDAGAVKNAFGQTQKRFGSDIHVLVNNSGLGYFKNMEELPWEQWKQMFDVNVHGIYHCSVSVIPRMKKQQSGHIINISSIAGLTGMPEGTGYCGTKFAVKGISEAMFKELREHKVKVTCVYPGSVNTDFFDNYPGVDANETMMDPNEVAKQVIHVLETPDNFLALNLEIRPMNPKYKK